MQRKTLLNSIKPLNPPAKHVEHQLRPLPAGRPLSGSSKPTLKTTPKVLTNKLKDEPAMDVDLMIEQLKQQIKECELRQQDLDFQTSQVRSSQALSFSAQFDQEAQKEIQQLKQKMTEQANECRGIIQEIKQSNLTKEEIALLDLQLAEKERDLAQQQAEFELQKQEQVELEEQIAAIQCRLGELSLELEPLLGVDNILQTQLDLQQARNKELQQQQLLFQHQLQELDEEQLELEQQLHELAASDQVTEQLRLKNEYEDAYFEHLQSKKQRQTYLTDLSKLDDEIYSQKVQNADLMNQMRNYARTEGFDEDVEDVDEFLFELKEFIRQKQRPKTSPGKKTELNYDEILKENSMFKVIKRQNGEIEFQLLVEPVDLDVSQLLELFQQIDLAQEYMKKVINQPTKDIDWERQSDIDEHSERDTIDEEKEDREWWV